MDAAALANLTASGEVAGSLNKEIIRRIIRSHIGEVKSCYEHQIERAPQIGGRIEVQFTIAASGQVIKSSLLNSTIDQAGIESCVVEAVHRWVFPKLAAGGSMTVSYPFTLVADDTPQAGHTLDLLGSQPRK